MEVYGRITPSIGYKTVTSDRIMSIYDSFCPLGVLGKIVGIFPAGNIFRGRYTLQKWILITYPTVFILKFVMLYNFKPTFLEGKFSHKDTVDIADMLEYLNFNFCATVQFIISVAKFKQISNLFCKLDTYDALTGGDVNEKMWKWAAWLVVVLLSDGALLSLLFGYFVAIGDESLQWFDIVHAFIALYMEICILWAPVNVLFLTISIRMRFARVSDSILNLIKEMNCVMAPSKSRLSPTAVAQRVGKISCVSQSMIKTVAPKHFEENAKEEMRNLMASYEELCYFVPTMNSAFDYSLTLGYFLIFAEIVLKCACVLFSTVILNIFRLVYVLTRIVQVVPFTFLVDNICAEAVRILPELRRRVIMPMIPECRAQVEDLIQRMAKGPVCITAADFFQVNRSLITSMIGAITTYLIILAQFKGAEFSCETGNSTQHG